MPRSPASAKPYPTMHCSALCRVPVQPSPRDCSSPSVNNASVMEVPSRFSGYTGIAPVTESSGNKHWVHWRLQCPTFIRQTFVEWAGATIPRSFWAAAYYRQQRDKGCSHQAAVRALAFKWIRILYRCWQTRTPYDEATYLNALSRRGSPLLASITTTA